MLSKKVCMACISKHISGTEEDWSTLDEKYWYDDGVVECPGARGSSLSEVSEPPPKGCPYALEHKVMETANA